MSHEIEDAEEFVRHEFRLGSRQPDGGTLRDQLKVVWKTTGRKPAELDSQAELPELFYEVWGWFLKLHSKRTSNGFGVNPISYLEMLAYFELMQYKPQSWEIMMIEKFDDIAMQAFDEDRKKKEQQDKQKQKSKK